MDDAKATAKQSEALIVSDGRLAQGKLGLREIFFQSMAAMAPGGALAVSVAVAANYAGGALPLAVILGFLPCLTVAVSIGQLSKHLPSAGSIYTFPARALHPNLGFLVGWGYVLSSAAWCPAVALMTAFQIAGLVAHGDITRFRLVWMASLCCTSLLVLLLGYRGIGLSAKTGTVLGMTEVLIFLALAVALFFAAAKHDPLAPFKLSYANAKGYEGIAGILVAAVFSVQAFVGFEAAAPLAEEAIDPKRTIKRGTLLACIGVGIFFVLTSYAASLFRGPETFSSFGASLDQGNPWLDLGRSVWGAAGIIVFIAVISSNLGGQNAFSNAASRTLFALSRIHLVPRAFEKTHSRWKTPYVAILSQFVFTLLIGGLVGTLFGPVDGSVLLATLCTAVPLAVYVLINISCTTYYWREKRDEFRWLLHGVMPLFGAVVLAPILYIALGGGSSRWSFVAPLPYPISLVGPILLAWYFAGLIYLAYLIRTSPERLQQMSEIFTPQAKS